MKYKLIIVILAAILLSSCSPYPRYRKKAVSMPQEVNSSEESVFTDDYIRFGLIMQKYLGKPYKGKSRWVSGIDCSSFTYDVFYEFNKTTLPRKAIEQYKEGVEVPRGRLKYGDLVFFRTERDRISHVGIYTGYNEFIHASTSRGVIISNLSEKYWAKRYVGARRILK